MKFLPRKDVFITQLKISYIPLILAVIYAVVGFFSAEAEKRSITILINYFAAGFFFLMWLVGQYLRTAKQIDDSANYQGIQTGITDVKESINKLLSLQVQPQPMQKTSSTLLEGAIKATEDGHVLAGLMQAGVALEQAIINAALKHGIEAGQRIPVYRAIQGLSQVLSEGVLAEIFAVWKLRNQLVHLTPEAAKELSSRPELINYFQWAISELERCEAV